MAEESTNFAGDASTGSGGLGFWYKWNLGWMHDTLDYMKLDPGSAASIIDEADLWYVVQPCERTFCR
ncbi:hypothetical protein KCP76_07910 [Salmonella enterica subsp. enterica serovar Weltevreden]|nr:hypothetical protein KCP76_07910 [Salmonella enterica subsp. enterica serovar Weltevreden]